MWGSRSKHESGMSGDAHAHSQTVSTTKISFYTLSADALIAVIIYE